MIVAAEAASVAMTKTASMVRDVSAVAGPVRIVTTGAMAIRTAGGWADRIRFSPVKAAISHPVAWAALGKVAPTRIATIAAAATAPTSREAARVVMTEIMITAEE